ncbi:hypothetical protein SETIT_4G146400v2 [Setaria italica]|uniref:Uncharacterized protein n=1 Tax=Setaria italica TaxID=4555 RepID=A0A368QUR3_SETIT|nr:hypothetical protein SETIT_4G146400v2 [Setaria italica]
MRISEQLGSGADYMQVDQVEDNTDDKTDRQPCLNLEISGSFLTCIRLMLAWDRNAFLQSKYNDRIKYEELTTAQNQLTSTMNCKRVSTDLPLVTLTIGNKKARSSLQYFSADKPLPGKFTRWKVDDSKEDDCFPESKFVFLEIEKGMLEKGLAKLLYIDPRLQRSVEFARASEDQHMYQGRLHAHTQQTNMSALQPLLSVNALPNIGGRM